MPEVWVSRCSTVTASSTRGRSAPSSSRAGWSSRSAPSSTSRTIASAVNALLPLAIAIRVSGVIGAPSARWRNPSARSTARRSPTSTVTTPVKSSSATAASSSCSAMCTGGRYAPPSPRGSEYASSGQPEPTGQVAGGDAARRRGHLGRGAGGDDASAGVAATGAQVDDPVRGGDGVQVVLDHDDGVPGVDEAVQLVEQEGDVGGVEPGGRLVEEVEGVVPACPLELGGELDALGLAAAELGGGLSEPQVPQADVAERLQAAGGGRDVAEEVRGLADGHLQHVGDGAAPVAHLEGLRVVTGPAAGGARRVRPGEEEQLDGDEALALARLAPPLGDVEGEPAGGVAAGVSLVGGGVEPADDVEEPGLGREVRAWGAADRSLVDDNEPVDGVQAGGGAQADVAVGGVLLRGAAEVSAHELGEHLGDEGRLPGPGHSGHRRQDA